METAEERAREFVGMLPEKLVKAFEKELVNSVVRLLNDQDGITRKTCIEEVSSVEYSHQGMGCGLEDRLIVDRYNAMEYGFEKAIQFSLQAIMDTELF